MNKSVGMGRTLWLVVALGANIVLLVSSMSEVSPVQPPWCPAPAHESGKVYDQVQQVERSDPPMECWSDEYDPAQYPDSWQWCRRITSEPLLASRQRCLK